MFIKLWAFCTALGGYWSWPLPSCCHLSNACCVAGRATRHGFALCDWSVIFLSVLADGYSVQCVWKRCTQTNSLCASKCWRSEGGGRWEADQFHRGKFIAENMCEHSKWYPVLCPVRQSGALKLKKEIETEKYDCILKGLSSIYCWKLYLRNRLSWKGSFVRIGCKRPCSSNVSTAHLGKGLMTVDSLGLTHPTCCKSSVVTVLRN